MKTIFVLTNVQISMRTNSIDLIFNTQETEMNMLEFHAFVSNCLLFLFVLVSKSHLLLYFRVPRTNLQADRGDVRISSSSESAVI
jgi:hypothetical protein